MDSLLGNGTPGDFGMSPSSLLSIIGVVISQFKALTASTNDQPTASDLGSPPIPGPLRCEGF